MNDEELFSTEDEELRDWFVNTIFTGKTIAEINKMPKLELDRLDGEFEKLKKLLASRDQQIALAARTVNRFEVINHLSDGSGREVVVWKGEPFKVELSLQDQKRTLKVFLTDIATLKQSQKEKPSESPME